MKYCSSDSQDPPDHDQFQTTKKSLEEGLEPSIFALGGQRLTIRLPERCPFSSTNIPVKKLSLATKQSILWKSTGDIAKFKYSLHISD